MSMNFDLSQFDEYREDNRREVKKANGGLPISLWDTYSAFANCYGGIIILGVKEEKDGSWKTTGLQNASKLQKDFWDTINNSKKVNINLLSEDDVELYEVGDNKDIIMVIYVPMAKREQKPVYINNDIFNGTFRRNYEGDYHCTRLQVKTMLRDQTERTMDMEVLDKVPMEDLNYDTIHGYRNSHRSLKEGHPFERLSDHEYLRSIGAAAISEEDGKLHPTAAGMLMFGDEYNIVRHFPEYFLDYREDLDPATRWSDRLQSSSGEWSGNVCDFYFRVYNKIIKDINVFLLRKKKHCTSEYEMILQEENVGKIASRDFSLLENNSFHLVLGDKAGYIWIDANYSDEKGKRVLYNDIYGNTYCTNAISINGRVVKMSKIVSLYLCYYAFSMLARYHPEKWKAFCESSDIAIIRKLLINCRREMLVEVIQLLSGKEYSFTTVMEEIDAELDASEVYKLVKEEAWREYKRTGRNTIIF